MSSQPKGFTNPGTMSKCDADTRTRSLIGLVGATILVVFSWTVGEMAAADPVGSDLAASLETAHLGTAQDAVGEPAPPRSAAVDSARESAIAAAAWAPDSLMALSDLVDRGLYGPAAALARRTVAHLRAARPPDSLALASAMDLLLQALVRSGTRAQPEWLEIAREALSMRESSLKPQDPDIATSLNRLANLLADNASYDAAEPLYQRALSIREKAFGPDQPKVAEVLINLAMLYRNTGNWRAAHPLYLRAMTIWDRALGSQFPLLSQSVNSLVVGLWNSGYYAEARMLSERLVSIWEKATGPDHPEIAFSLRAASVLMQGTGNWRAGWPSLERALAMFESSVGPDHPDVALSYTALASIFMATGEHGLARKLYERGIAIWERILGPEHPDLALGLEYLASLLRKTGDYSEARQACERALKIREKAFGPDHPLVAVSLDDVVQLLLELGDHGAAQPLAQRALEISERALGPNHPQVASALAPLAYLRYLEGDLKGAKRTLQRRLEIVESSIGPDQLETANALSDLAVIVGAMGDHHAARELGERALLINEGAVGPDHPFVASVLKRLAVECQLAGDPRQAREMLTRAIAIEERALGPRHPRVASSLTSLAMLLRAQSDEDAAADVAIRAEEIGREAFHATARALPERQALAYETARPSGLSIGLLLIPKIAQPETKRRIIDALIRSRAMVLDEMGARHRSLSISNDPEVERAMATFSSASARYAALLVRGPESAHPERYRPLLDQARQEMERAEGEVAGKSAAYRREQSASGIGIAEVGAALPRGTALVGFALYPQRLPNWGDLPPPSYLAYVLRGGTDSIAVVQVNDAHAVDLLIANWNREIAKAVMKDPGGNGGHAYHRAGVALRRSLWDPLTPHLQGVERVLVVPDGAINLVNLVTLPLDDGKYLLEEGPLIHCLSAERDVVTLDSLREEGSGLLAIGGPAFDERPSVVLASSGAPSRGTDRPAVVGASGAYRGRHTGCSDFVALRFEPLPGTLGELREIERLWSTDSRTSSSTGNPARGSGPVVELIGAKAGEGAFKRDAPGHAVLHLATHGFFLTGNCSPTSEDIRPATETLVTEPGRSPAAAMGESPLVLSGLALAGANHRSEAKPDEDDGILTAEEIATLNLTGVGWAVLSACETGVGNVRAGEGVFGLRRAFQVAGARTLIMSLWAVEDARTQRWIRALYEARIQRGLSTAEAVRAASLEVLNERRRRGQSTHPATWGAFIAAGDWK